MGHYYRFGEVEKRKVTCLWVGQSIFSVAFITILGLGDYCYSLITFLFVFCLFFVCSRGLRRKLEGCLLRWRYFLSVFIVANLRGIYMSSSTVFLLVFEKKEFFCWFRFILSIAGVSDIGCRRRHVRIFLSTLSIVPFLPLLRRKRWWGASTAPRWSGRIQFYLHTENCRKKRRGPSGTFKSFPSTAVTKLKGLFFLNPLHIAGLG